MPTFGDDGSDYKRRCERVRLRKIKLRSMGIVENSSKWFKLLHRR